MGNTFTRTARTALAAVLALSVLAPTEAAFAQAPPYPNPSYDDYQHEQGAPPPGYRDEAPPPGQYAPPPETDENGSYDPRAQQYDRDYAADYERWAQRYCVDKHNDTVAGAIIGGLLGAAVGAGVAGHHSRGAGAFVGGALGATAGAAIGANSNPGAACPPGYVVARGAPAFYYGSPYPPAVIYGPAWYNPWIFVGGHWAYHPYREWYWGHRDYWGPDRRGRGWDDRRRYYHHW